MNQSFFAVTNDYMENDKKHYITIFMKANYISGEPEIKEPKKCVGWSWYSWDDLPNPLLCTSLNINFK